MTPEEAQELAQEYKRDGIALVEMRNTQGWRVYQGYVESLRSEYADEIRSFLGAELTQQIKDKVFNHSLKLAALDAVNERMEAIIEKAMELMVVEKQHALDEKGTEQEPNGNAQ